MLRHRAGGLPPRRALPISSGKLSNVSRRSAVLSLCGLVLLLLAAAPERRLTLDDLYDPEKKIQWEGTPPVSLSWIDETHYRWARPDRKTKRTDHLKVEALSGQAVPLFDPDRMSAALRRAAGSSAEEADRLSHESAVTINEAATAALVTARADLYCYDFVSGQAVRLTNSAAGEEEPTFSPDGRRAAFVRDHDLYVVDLANGKERRLTTGGGKDLLNGKLDWIYQEEIYGRHKYRGYWWSPDSSRIAFLQLDEKDVPRYPVLDDAAFRPTVENGPYPKPGDPNPRVRLAVVSAEGGSPVWVKTDRYPTDILIVDVTWLPDSRRLSFQVQDREQTWLELDVAEVASGENRTLLREQGSAWVENPGPPRWLKDGSFLLLSERTGWRHVYHFRANGSLLGPLTEGRWEARALHGVDEAAGWVYYSGTERRPVGEDVYRVRLDGSGRERLSSAPGTHEAKFNPSNHLYLDFWSDAATPMQVRLHRADGAFVREVDPNPVSALREFRLARPEFVEVKTRDGFVMEGLLLKPPDFDPSRRYPVYQSTYGGPHSPLVKDAWGGTGRLFHHLLAQRGIVVWLLDNRTASGKGIESVWPGYQHMGELELQDIEDGVAWLKQQPWVDPARIGIEGWSYGGFMVSYALTHSRSFAMGIAGGPVTDWRDYDSIYTERYMRTPQNNPEGYKKTSPRAAAASLQGKLLLLHGAIDDNVHPQNTTEFAYELQKAGKPFRLMLYPKSRHGVVDPALAKHLHATMLSFIEETLLPPWAASPETSASHSSRPSPVRP
jgi:dipeptidyl-peptidase 4